MVKTLLIGALAVFMILHVCSAREADQDNQLKAILGTDIIRSCRVDNACVLVPAFDDCCAMIAVNKAYQDKVLENMDALRKAYMSEEQIHRCTVVECMPPQGSAICAEGQCEASSLH